MKRQRIRDPLHDLIEFNTDFELGLWDVLDSIEFQRLRRVKQLAFSELVYPGATHSRFIHSVGVFHTARILLKVVKENIGESNFDEDRAQIALTAALVHDVGHGPFSHAFETALLAHAKAQGNKLAKKHEHWSAQCIEDDTELGSRIENLIGADGRNSVSQMLTQETPSDIYSAIVSSQLDADRLDYVRRDRLMTGAQHGGFDFPWLIANLEVGQVIFSVDDEEIKQSEMLILGRKAFQAAESYVLGLFHLYFSVYFHKATRSAEKMLTALILEIGKLVLENNLDQIGLPVRHPIVLFFQEQSLTNYLRLDDTVIWGALHMLSDSKNSNISELSQRLLRRDLYKAVDTSLLSVEDAMKFRANLQAAFQNNQFQSLDVFEDSATRSPYKHRGYESIEALSKVFIRTKDGKNYEDLGDQSDVVKALNEKNQYTVYVRNSDIGDAVKKIMGGN